MNPYLVILGLILFIIILIIHFNTEKSYTLRIPAEYEPQEYVILVSPDLDDDDKTTLGNNVKKERLHDFGLGKGFNTIADVQGQEILALRHVTKVIVVFRNKENKMVYDNVMRARGIDPLKDFFSITCPTVCDVWIRDTGPITGIKNGNKFCVWARWTQWGYYSPNLLNKPNYILEKSPPWDKKIKSYEAWSLCDIPNKLVPCISEKLKIPMVRPLLGNYIYSGEGGNKSFNGKGKLICSEIVEKQRNPNLTKEQLETIYRKYYGITEVVWVGKGLADDKQAFRGSSRVLEKSNKYKRYWVPIGTGGHIDEWCRFVGDNKVLIAYIPDYVELDDLTMITKQRMEANYNHLKTNYPNLELFRIPDAPLLSMVINNTDPIWTNLKSLSTTYTYLPEQLNLLAAGSYMNYLVSNSIILFPKYYEAGSKLASSSIIKKLDNEAGNIIQMLFPHKKIVRINPLPINFGGGGMHCTSCNIPK